MTSGNEPEKDESQQVVFDRRPLWVVILDRMRRGVVIAVLLIGFFVLLGRDVPEGLSTWIAVHRQGDYAYSKYQL